MADVVEASFNVSFQYPLWGAFSAQPSVQDIYRIGCTTVPTETVRVSVCRCFRHRFQALSFMVGMPNGRFFPLLLAIYTLFSGQGRYPCLFKERIAFSLSAGVIYFTLSTPDVRFPLLDVTRFTAKSLALKEMNKRYCKAFTLLYLFSF